MWVSAIYKSCLGTLTAPGDFGPMGCFYGERGMGPLVLGKLSLDIAPPSREKADRSGLSKLLSRQVRVSIWGHFGTMCLVLHTFYNITVFMLFGRF